MPRQIPLAGFLGSWREEQYLAQRRLPVVLPGKRILVNCCRERPGHTNAQPAVHSEHARVEGHVVGRAGGQAIPRIETFAWRTVAPGLDMTSQQHAGGTERAGCEAAEYALAAAVLQHPPGENMLPHPGRRQQYPFRLQLGPGTPAGLTADLFLQFCFEHGDVEIFLPEQDQVPTVLKLKEIGQPARPDALGPGSLHQHPVEG